MQMPKGGQAQPQQPQPQGTPYNPQQGQPFGAWSPQQPMGQGTNGRRPSDLHGRFSGPQPSPNSQQDWGQLAASLGMPQGGQNFIPGVLHGDPRPGMWGGAAGSLAMQPPPPQLTPEQMWEQYDREIAGQRRLLPGGGVVSDLRAIPRPPVARPGSSPSPYSSQDEYRRFMNQHMPGWHTDRALKKMVPWEFNPANPDRGAAPHRMTNLMHGGS